MTDRQMYKSVVSSRRGRSLFCSYCKPRARSCEEEKNRGTDQKNNSKVVNPHDKVGWRPQVKKDDFAVEVSWCSFKALLWLIDIGV